MKSENIIIKKNQKKLHIYTIQFEEFSTFLQTI